MLSALERRAAEVEVIIFDVDGVLTDGSVIYGPDGEWKVFNVRDGAAFKVAKRHGLRIGLLTGRESRAVTRRSIELGVDLLEQGAARKGPALAKMIQKFGVRPEHVCYVGDDLVDIPALRRVGVPVAVADAVKEVKDHALWVTMHKGGEGAAREVIDAILKVKGLWDSVMKRYLEEEVQ